MEKLVSLEKENIYADLWRLSWPVMLFMVFQSSLELVDFFWVGRLGTDPLAALSLSHSIFWMLFTFSQLITVSTLSLVSRYQGNSDPEGVHRVVRHSFWISILMSLVVITFIFAFGGSVLSLYDVEREVYDQALIYLQVAGVGFIFLYGSVALAFALQGVGDSFTSMGILILTNIINIILDPILIFGWLGFPAMGISGAALASLIARALGFFAILYVVLSGRLSPSKLKISGLFKPVLSGQLIKRIFKIGLPACLQGITRPITGAVMMWIVALFGTEAVAAFGIGLRLLSFCFIMIAGLNMGTATMVGQSLGAKLKEITEEVIRKSMKLALSIQTIMAVVAFALAPLIMGLFTNDQAVIDMGNSYLRLIAPALVVMGPLHVIAAVFKGAGFTMPHMVSAIIANWIVKIPLALLLSLVLNLDTNGVWMAISLSIFAELGILLFWYRYREKIFIEAQEQLKIDEISDARAYQN